MTTFNPLIDEPPTEAVVNGRIYPLSTDYRRVLSYSRTEADQDLEPGERAFVGLRLFFGDSILRDDAEGLVAFLRWYISRGRPVEEEADHVDPVFDLLVDSGRIYAAFFQVYQINLRKVRLHWWLFCELLEGLPRGTHLSEVIEIRSRSSKGLSQHDQAQLARAKDRYRIGKKKDIGMGLFEALKGIAR